LAPSANQASAPFGLERLDNALVDRLVASGLALLVGEHVIGTPQARWRDSTQSGRSSIIAQAGLAGTGTKRVSSIALSARFAQRVAVAEILVHVRRTIAACCGR
jgi:hypothetical protein